MVLCRVFHCAAVEQPQVGFCWVICGKKTRSIMITSMTRKENLHVTNQHLIITWTRGILKKHKPSSTGLQPSCLKPAVSQHFLQQSHPHSHMGITYFMSPLLECAKEIYFYRLLTCCTQVVYGKTTKERVLHTHHWSKGSLKRFILLKMICSWSFQKSLWLKLSVYLVYEH